MLLALIIFVPAATLLPKLAWRRQSGRLTMRLFCLLAGIRLELKGLDNLPSGAAVVVANHCSYIDGPLLSAVLPPHFSLVIKREAGNVPLVGFFLRRLEHILVERKQARQAANDAQRIIDHLEAGEAVGIFAEGTFSHQIGVQRFKPSAFIGAVRHKTPVVPVAIKGTRQLWPDQRRSLRPAKVCISLLPPIMPVAKTEHSERQQARQIAETSRRHIAAAISEPLL